MSLTTRLAPYVTPYSLSDLYVQQYFVAPDVSVMVWGRPGVGKSAATLTAAVEISAALDSAVRHAFRILYALESAGNAARARSVAYKIAELLTRSLPVRTESGYDFVVIARGAGERPETLSLSSLAARMLEGDRDERERLAGQLLAARVSTTPQSRYRAAELAEILLWLYRAASETSRNGVLKGIVEGTFPLPLVLFNESIELIDYPCFAVVTPARMEGMVREGSYRCVRRARKEACAAAVTPAGCIAVRHDDHEFALRVARCMVAGRRAPAVGEALARVEDALRAACPGADVPAVCYAGLFFHYVDMRLSQLELDDIKGLPSDVLARAQALRGDIEGAKAARVLWLAPAWLAARGLGVLFFDEINQAQPWAQAAAYNIILDRRLATGKSLSPNVMVVAAGNQPDFAPGVARALPPPLRNRFANFVMEPEVPPPATADDRLVAKLHEIAYGRLAVGAKFVEWLRSLGFDMDPGEAGWYRGMAAAMAPREPLPEHLRDFVVVTNRSLELLKRLFPFTPGEFQALMRAAVAHGRGTAARLALYAALSFYGVMGIPGAPRVPGETDWLRLYGLLVAVVASFLELLAARRAPEELRSAVETTASLASALVETGMVTREQVQQEVTLVLRSPPPVTLDAYANAGVLLKLPECGGSETPRRAPEMPRALAGTEECACAAYRYLKSADPGEAVRKIAGTLSELGAGDVADTIADVVYRWLVEETRRAAVAQRCEPERAAGRPPETAAARKQRRAV
jgi:hypothetical protein